MLSFRYLGHRPTLGAWVATTVLVVFASSELAAQSKPTSQSGPVGVGTVVKTGSVVKTYPHCTRKHPGRQHRAESLVKQGDSRMALSAARHTVRYAIDRYGIQDIVTEADIDRADDDVYRFYSWKLGNPALVAAQWLTAGYQHFDSHADEAAASLLGYDLPGPGNVLRLPKVLTAWLKTQVDSASGESNSEICGAISSSSDGSGASTTPGEGGNTTSSGGSGSTIAGFACTAVVELLRQAGNRVVDRLGISGDMLMGNTKFDIKDQEIELLEQLRRNPPAATASATGRQPTLPGNLKLPGRVPAPRQ
jgi:hypothetical protein